MSTNKCVEDSFGMQVLSDEAVAARNQKSADNPEPGACRMKDICRGPQCKDLAILCSEDSHLCPHNINCMPMIFIGKPVTRLGVLSGDYLKQQKEYMVAVGLSKSLTSTQQYL
jgi:hypothetical protein